MLASATVMGEWVRFLARSFLKIHKKIRPLFGGKQKTFFMAV
jgi:hypothetical protein